MAGGIPTPLEMQVRCNVGGGAGVGLSVLSPMIVITTDPNIQTPKPCLPERSPLQILDTTL